MIPTPLDVPEQPSQGESWTNGIDIYPSALQSLGQLHGEVHVEQLGIAVARIHAALWQQSLFPVQIREVNFTRFQQL